MENVVIAEHVIGQPGRARGQRDNGVEPVRGEWPVQRLPGQAARFGACGQVAGLPEVACGCLGTLEVFLSEMGQHRAGVLHVVFNETGQVCRVRAAQIGQVGIQIVFELVRQRGEFRFVDPGRAGQFHRVHQFGTGRAQQGERLLKHRGGGRARVLGAVPPHAEARPAQRVAVEAGRVVAGRRGRGRGRRVGRVRAGQHGQQRGGVRHRPGHRARGVLGRGDRHDPGAADQAQSRLDADDPARARRADDAAVGLRADRERCQARRDRHPGTRTRSGRVAAGPVRVDGLPAERAPPTGGVGGAEVRPLGQAGLAEDHRACLAQPGDQEGLVLVGLGEGRRTGRGGQPCHGDVVLDQDRDARQRPGHRAARTGLVAGPRLGGGLRADADDRVQRRVEPFDPAGVESCQFGGGEGAVGEGPPQRCDRRGVRIEPGPPERLAYLRRCAGLGHGRRITAWMYQSARWPPSRR